MACSTKFRLMTTCLRAKFQNLSGKFFDANMFGHWKWLLDENARQGNLTPAYTVKWWKLLHPDSIVHKEQRNSVPPTVRTFLTTRPDCFSKTRKKRTTSEAASSLLLIGRTSKSGCALQSKCRSSCDHGRIQSLAFLSYWHGWCQIPLRVSIIRQVVAWTVQYGKPHNQLHDT